MTSSHPPPRKRPSDVLGAPPNASQQQQQQPPPLKKPAMEHRSASVRDSIPSAAGAAKPYKGLRHFSMMVCKKVEEKGVTTYNEVADELVEHVITERRKEEPHAKCDEKNIRRRVYDALNVLMAMDIITKEKKAISWKGLPTSAHSDLDMLVREKEFRQQEVHRKKEALRELLVQQVCFRNLVALNSNRKGADSAKTGEESNNDAKDKTVAAETQDNHKIPLPFIVVNTHCSAVIQCNMSRDLTDVMFDFSQPFAIDDDNTILKRLGMHKTDRDTLQQMLPPDLMRYAEQHGMLATILEPQDGKAPALAATRDYVGSSAPKQVASSSYL